MTFSFGEILLLFFLYSFIGWIYETVAAAVKQKRFVNKGLVNLPFCTLYGGAAIFITVFGSELQGIWLYIGSVIMITVFKWVSGRLIERIYHERWWDYSDKRWNIDGYAHLLDSVLLGVAAAVMIKWVNPLLLKAFGMLPHTLVIIGLWVLSVALVLDILATLIALYGKESNAEQWENVDKWFTKLTISLSKRIHSSVDKRIKRAYPNVKQVEKVKASDTVFAAGCSVYKVLWLFAIGAFLGDITETIYCRITAGVWMSRSSVVWGPFSIVWGLAIAVFTVLLYKYKDSSDRVLFFAGTVLGGAYEYVCSVFTEIVFGKVFWDYSHIRFNLGGRINLLYCFFWGIAAVVWIKGIYPKVSAWIEKTPIKLGKILSWIMIVFMCCNMAVSSMALVRSTQRQNDIPAEHTWQKIMDERFDDERLSRIYPNAIER